MAALFVLGGVEDGEMLSDYLLGVIPLDAMSPFVPSGDVAIGVEHEDSVVLDALDQKAEALFALAEDLPGPPGRPTEVGRLHRHYRTTSKTNGCYCYTLKGRASCWLWVEP
jgi:hypothetical protein